MRSMIPAAWTLWIETGEVNMREHTPWPAESGPELDLSGRFRGILERYSLSEGFSYGAWGTNEPAA